MALRWNLAHKKLNAVFVKEVVQILFSKAMLYIKLHVQLVQVKAQLSNNVYLATVKDLNISRLRNR